MPTKTQPPAENAATRRATREKVPEDQKILAALFEIADVLRKINSKLAKMTDSSGKANRHPTP